MGHGPHPTVRDTFSCKLIRTSLIYPIHLVEVTAQGVHHSGMPLWIGKKPISPPRIPVKNCYNEVLSEAFWTKKSLCSVGLGMRTLP